MIPERIKIKFDGPLGLATAYDAETGEAIPFIKRVDLVTGDANNDVFEARLVVDIDPIEGIEGEVIAATRVPKTLSDAEFDEIARRVDDRMKHQILFPPHKHGMEDAEIDHIVRRVEERLAQRMRLRLGVQHE